MRHYIDLDTDQLMRLYALLYDRRDMQDIVEKLRNHMEIVRQKERRVPNGYTSNTKEK